MNEFDNSPMTILENKVYELKKENAELKELVKNLLGKLNTYEKMDSIKQVHVVTVENIKLRELLKEVTYQGKEDIGPRIDYYHMQFDKGLFREITEALDEKECE